MDGESPRRACSVLVHVAATSSDSGPTMPLSATAVTIGTTSATVVLGNPVVPQAEVRDQRVTLLMAFDFQVVVYQFPNPFASDSRWRCSRPDCSSSPSRPAFNPPQPPYASSARSTDRGWSGTKQLPTPLQARDQLSTNRDTGGSRPAAPGYARRSTTDPPPALPACPCGSRRVAQGRCTSGCQHSRPACAADVSHKFADFSCL